MKKFILLLLCSFFISCFTEPKKVENTAIEKERNVKKGEKKNDETLTTNTQSIQHQKKFIYIKIKISTPVLYGKKSEFLDIPSICYAKYEDENNLTDVIELDTYNEDIKYRLLDDFEKKVKEQYKNIGTSLYLEAFDKYGSREADEIKKEEYNIKILSRDIFVFDSYSEASINKNNEK